MSQEFQFRNIQKEFQFRLVKIADIGYITAWYFFFAFLLSTWIDARFFGPFEPKKADTKTTVILLLECVLHIYMVGILIYLIRNFTELIPSPFEGVAGLEHRRVKELSNAAVFTFVFLFYQKHLRDKLEYIYVRLYGSRR